MRQSNIYLLRDPNTNEVRYVGQCLNRIEQRLHRHIRSSREKTSRWTKKENWIRSLGDKNPIAELIEVCDYSDVDDREIFYIKHYKELGSHLTNLTEGGKGRVFKGENHPSFGKPLSTETKRKISEANLGSKNGMFGRTIIQSDETKAKRRESMRGSDKLRKSRSSESFKKKISEASREKLPIVFISESTGEIKFHFSSVYDAADALGCTRCNIFHAIKDHRAIGKRIKTIGERCLVKYETMEISKITPLTLVPGSDKG